jgi:AMP phosphorylase
VSRLLLETASFIDAFRNNLISIDQLSRGKVLHWPRVADCRMKLIVKSIGLEAFGKSVVILNTDDAAELGTRSSGRVRLKGHDKEITALVNTTSRIVKKGEVGVYQEVQNSLGLSSGELLDVDLSSPPSSITHIRNRLEGRKLGSDEIAEIIRDTVRGDLSEIELSAFVTSLNTFHLDLDEATSMSTAMVESGKTLKLNRKPIVDKHSIGGVPGDKTTLVVVPIIAACGLTIPKTSSRAITSAAGSADRAEVLMPVNLDIDDVERVVEKTGGCLVWGGSLHLAPADDIFVQIEYPLSIDPLLLPSIISKKKAVGAEFVVIDIPLGMGAKVKTIADARLLARDFMELGKRLGMRIQCAITNGSQPVGHAIGAALEAKEALETLARKTTVADLIDKATDLAGMIINMTGGADGKRMAAAAISQGKAEKKLREIIAEQGGDSEMKPEDIKIGEETLDFQSSESGQVLWINNSRLVEAARLAGAPRDKGAGLILHKKTGDKVNEGERILSLYAEKTGKLEKARESLQQERAVMVGHRTEMTMAMITEMPVHKEPFILER